MMLIGIICVLSPWDHIKTSFSTFWRRLTNDREKGGTVKKKLLSLCFIHNRYNLVIADLQRGL